MKLFPQLFFSRELKQIKQINFQCRISVRFNSLLRFHNDVADSFLPTISKSQGGRSRKPHTAGLVLCLSGCRRDWETKGSLLNGRASKELPGALLSCRLRVCTAVTCTLLIYAATTCTALSRTYLFLIIAGINPKRDLEGEAQDANVVVA